MKFVLVILYLALSISGLIFMKLGGNSGTFSVANKDISFTVSWISAIGFICYIASFLLYTRIIILFNLSYILPLCTGIVQILTLISSKLIFKENISSYGIIGASIIIIGLVIMNLSNTIKT